MIATNPRRCDVRPVRVMVLAAVAAAIALVTVVRGGQALAATGPQTGAVIVDPTTEVALTGTQGSMTPFQIELPAESACSEDTTGGGYHIYGYLVPSTTSPAALAYNSVGPAGGFPLIEQSGSLYSAINTVASTGAIPEPTPALLFGGNYGAFGSHIAAGAYNIGISCTTPAGTADKFWNNEIAFTADSSDPNGFAWALVSHAVATATVLAASPPSPQLHGTAVTMTATVTPAAAGSAQFFDGAALLGTTSVSSGVATFTASGLAVASHSLKAVFTPSDTTAFAASTSNVITYVVTATSGVSSTTSTTLASSTTSTTVATATTTATTTTTVAATDTGTAADTGTTSGTEALAPAGSSSNDPTSGSAAALAATGVPISDYVTWALLLIVLGGVLVEIARGRLQPYPTTPGRTARGGE